MLYYYYYRVLQLQYAQIGITEHETTEDDESSPPTAATVNGDSPVTHERDGEEGEEREEEKGSNGIGIFDDPKYVRGMTYTIVHVVARGPG